MAFDEIQFPPQISEGASTGPGHSTAVVTLPFTEAEERSGRSDGARHFYDAAKGVSSFEDMAEIKAFCMARRGALRGFRWKDWADFTSRTDGRSAPTPTDVEIGVGDGATVNFQLIKKYTSGVITVSRLIEKPVAGSTRVAVDGVEAMSGWTVNTTSGVVTFSVAPTLGQVITAGCEFDVPARFTKDADTWMRLEVTDFDNASVPSIPIVELRSETPVDDEFHYGGSTIWNPLSANITLTALNGRVIVVNPNASGRTVALPDPANLSAGGPWFYITNTAAVDSVNLLDHLGATVATVAPLTTVTVLLIVDAMSQKAWIAV